MSSTERSRTRTIAYLALYIALYIALKYVGNLIPFLQMPNGGSIELELIAVFLASYQLGWKNGVIVAILAWLLTFILGFPMWFVSPMQTLLDYVLPLVVCGMASLLWPFRSLNKPAAICMAVIIAVAAYFGITKSWNGTASQLVGVIVAIAAGAFTYWYVQTRKRFGIVISMLLKYVFQMLSGVFFWFPEGSAAGSAEAWTYSIGYNLWYNLVTMVVCIFVAPMIIDRLEKSGIRFVK